MLNSTTDSPFLARCNVLTLDGGGVRGLSSLLILEALMQYVNQTLRAETNEGDTFIDAKPHDIFNFVAGTSTGGLIAIMLGKLGMSIQECIVAYRDLSQRIFARKHFRGRITFGLAITRYSGRRLDSCTQKLIKKKNIEVTVPMAAPVSNGQIACAVICREHSQQSKYSPLKQDAVPICSLECHRQVECTINQAARATSAAPTYFPVQKIGDRFFVDGGLEYNNPSEVIFEYYTGLERGTNSRRSSRVPRHGRLNFLRARFINLGTGTQPENPQTLQPSRYALFVPALVRMALFLRQALLDSAVNSEKTANTMNHIAFTSRGNEGMEFAFERFSADTGVCSVELDDYKKLDLIAKLTHNYLEKTVVASQLQKLGEELAKEYLHKRNPMDCLQQDQARDTLATNNNNSPR